MKWNYCLRYTFDLNLQVYDLLVNQDQSVYTYASSAFRVLMAAKNRITITGLNNRLSLSHHYYLGKSNYSAVFTDSLATSVSLLRAKMSQYVVYQTSLLLVTCHEQIGKNFGHKFNQDGAFLLWLADNRYTPSNHHSPLSQGSFFT